MLQISVDADIFDRPNSTAKEIEGILWSKLSIIVIRWKYSNRTQYIDAMPYHAVRHIQSL